MRVVVVTPPAPAVSYEEADAHLALDGDTDRMDYVTSLIAAAQGHIDGPMGWLGRAIGWQTLEARFDNWDCGSLRLPYPPLVSITSVKYVDAAGAEQTVSPALYETMGDALVPVYGAAWPTARWQREAVRVRYQAGYGGVGLPLPAPIRAAILLMVGDLFRNPSTVAVGQTAMAVPMSTTVEALLATYRVYS